MGSSHRRGKVIIVLSFSVGVGVAALLSKGPNAATSSGDWTTDELAIDMAWQSVLARPSQVMPPTKFPAVPASELKPLVARSVQGTFSNRNELFRTNAFPKTAAFTGLELPNSNLIDVRQILRSSPVQKCISANEYASVCGNLVVLRPSTALRATTSGKIDIDADEIIKKASSKLDSIEDKPTVALFAGGAAVALVVLNGVVSSLESIPLLPKLFEIVGAGYSTYFSYRYLLNKDKRAELVKDIEKVKDEVFR